MENSFLLLHQRCKQTGDLLKQMHEEIAAAIFLQNGMAGLQGDEKILLDVLDSRAAEQERSALEVEIQTAEIQIGGTHSGDPIIRYKGLGVHETLKHEIEQSAKQWEEQGQKCGLGDQQKDDQNSLTK